MRETLNNTDLKDIKDSLKMLGSGAL